MPADPFPFDRCARVFRVLASAPRLRILRFLAGGPHSVGEIRALLAIGESKVTAHVAKLRHAGLICGERRGHSIMYTLAPGLLVDPADIGPVGEVYDVGCCRVVLPPGPGPERRDGPGAE
jgi:DNA-binding transcriptional ArsR family regulator